MTTMVITAALLTSSVASGAPALASGNCGNLQTGHCYAESAQGTTAGHTPIYLNNVGADLEVNCLAVRNDNTEFANWEMWVETDDTNPNSTTDSGYWVEEGYTAGTVLSGNTYYTGFQWYWADNRPGGGYNEHFIEWATANQYKNVTVTFAGGSNWDVYLGGSFVGESTNNAAYAGGVTLGAEMAVDNNGQVWANSKNWQYTNGGSWSPVDPTFTGYINDVPGYGISQSYNPTDVSVWTPSDQCGPSKLTVVVLLRGYFSWCCRGG
jgi:hypothetical protein